MVKDLRGKDFVVEQAKFKKHSGAKIVLAQVQVSDQAHLRMVRL